MKTLSLRILFPLVAVAAGSLALAVLAGGGSHPRSAALAEPSAGEHEGEGANEIRARDRWFYEQRAYPNAHTPPGALRRAARETRALRESRTDAATITWTSVGPQPIGTIGPDASAASGEYVGSLPVAGRVSAIAPDPNNASIVYVGGAAGGVWKSTDGGASWTAIFPTDQASFSIGAIAVDKTNSQNVWVGTGEANGSGDTYYGMGIFKSTNGGSSWTKVGGTQFDGCFVSDLAIVDSNTVVAAIDEFPGVTNPACSISDRGVWRTASGGSSWTRISLPLGTAPDYEAPADFSQVPNNPSTIFLATYIDGIYKSTDGGAVWTLVKDMQGTGAYRGVISAYDANTVYAAYSDDSDLLYAVYKTINGSDFNILAASGGGTNTPCTYPGDSTSGQCSYDFTLAVDPTNSTVFYMGGIRLFKYTGSGSTATEIAYGSASGDIHVDQHATVFDASNRLWEGSDGGVYRSDDAGGSFLNRNGSGTGALAITEFQPWTSGSIAGGTYIGGTQDNGTVKYTTASGSSWRMDHGGDGGGTAFVDSNTFYASYYGSNVYKTTNGGTSFSDVSGAWGSDARLFYPPLEMSPSDTNTLYRGTSRIWRTTNGASSWSAISSSYSGSPTPKVSAIGPAASNANVLYAGWTTDGSSTHVRYTTNGGSSWSDASGLPNLRITDFAVNPSDANEAYVTFSGFGAGHVYRTTNGGSSWTNMSGNLPDVPVNSIAVNWGASPNDIFLGTDTGVLWSSGASATWENTSSGLPNTVVMDLRIDGSSLVAATHGRSVFTAPLPNPASPRTLSVSKSGQGTVTSSPSGISCGSTCSHDFTYGSSVTLSAAAATGWRFAGYSGDCSGSSCTLSMTANHSVTATFTPRCIVPNVKRKKLAAATSAIRAAHCAVGKVKYARSKKKKGTVIAQSPPAGADRPANTKVNLVVSKGKKHR